MFEGILNYSSSGRQETPEKVDFIFWAEKRRKIEKEKDLSKQEDWATLLCHFALRIALNKSIIFWIFEKCNVRKNSKRPKWWRNESMAIQSNKIFKLIHCITIIKPFDLTSFARWKLYYIYFLSSFFYFNKTGHRNTTNEYSENNNMNENTIL